jgi:hypothetical protein
VKFNLLVAASALVVGLGMSGVAFAHDDGGDNNNHGTTSATSAAVALTDQDGAVIHNFAKGTVGANAIGTVNGTGLVNIQQNNGANSILQDQNTLGAILNCSCTSSSSTNVLDVSLAASEQNALVLGNVSIGAQNKSANGSSAYSSTSTKNSAASTTGSGVLTSASADGDDAQASATGGNSAAQSNDNSTHNSNRSWAFQSTAVASSNSLSSFGGTGLYNISQNNGNNSMLQSANTVAAIIGK